jgi:hypothetical protein
MIIVGNALVSEDILEKKFACQIDKCKGECCVQGDAGAPLLKDEADIILDIYDKIEPYISADGIAEIKENGFVTRDTDGDLVTVCRSSGECVFVVYEDKGIASCAIEKAHAAGDIDFKKPISCHLYPIRAKKYGSYIAMNYHHWDICNDACKAGSEMNVPVYEFLKEAIIRKMGEDWYQELSEIAKDWHNREKH